MVQLLNIYIIQ